MEHTLIKIPKCDTKSVRDLDVFNEGFETKFVPELDYVFYQYIHRRDTFFFVQKDSCEGFSFRPTRSSRFPFLSKSRRVRLIFNVMSSNSGIDTTFSSSLRLHIFEEELKNRKNVLDAGEMYYLRHDCGDLVEDFLNSINFEIKRKFPKRSFSVQKIMTEKKYQFSSLNIFSYFYLMNIDEKSVLTVFLQPQDKTISRNKSIQGTFKEDMYIRLRNCGFFKLCFDVLPKKDTVDDLRKIVFQLHTTFFLDRKRFLSVSKPYLLKIERKILGNCPKETFLKKSVKSKKKKKFGNQKKKKGIDADEIRKQISQCRSINTSASKVMKNLPKTTSFRIKGSGGLSTSLFQTFFEEIIISTILENDISNFFELSLRGGMGRVSPVLNPRYHSSCRLVESFGKYYLNTMIELSKKSLPKSMRRGGIDEKVKSILLKKSSIETIREGGKSKKSEECHFIPHERITYFFEVASLYHLEGRDEKAIEIIMLLCFEVRVGMCSSRTRKYGKFLMFPFSRFTTTCDPFLLRHHEQTRIYESILIETFLSGKRNIFIDGLKKKYENDFAKLNDIFFAIYKFCWNRGWFDLALFYIENVSKEQFRGNEETKVLWSKIRHSLSEVMLHFDLCQLDKIQNIALWIANLSKKITNLGAMVKYFSPQRVIDIVMTKEENNNRRIRIYRIPSFFCDGIKVVVGEEFEELEEEEEEEGEEEEEEDERNQEIYRELYVAKKSLLYDAKCEKEVKKVMLKGYRLTTSRLLPEEEGNNNNKNNKNSILLDFLYLLAATSFMEKKFRQFEKWIVYLSDLEFFHNSYTFSPKYHQLYQVVANLYYLEKKKKKKKNDSSLSLSSSTTTTRKKKILLVGDGQARPFVHQSLNISLERYEIVPIICEGLRIVHLQEYFPNKYRKMMIQKLKKNLSQEDDGDDEEAQIIIFMIGEMDIRDRVLDSVPNEFDHKLSTQFSEECQVELLTKLYLKEIKNIRNEIICDDNVKKKNLQLFIAPILPYLHPIEEERVFREKQNFGTFNVSVGNRVSLFNQLLEKKCGARNSKKNNIKFLEGLTGFVKMLKEGDDSIDLGFGAYIFPTDTVLRKLGLSLEIGLM